MVFCKQKGLKKIRYFEQKRSHD